jgi:hypothetical protein
VLIRERHNRVQRPVRQFFDLSRFNGMTFQMPVPVEMPSGRWLQSHD